MGALTLSRTDSPAAMLDLVVKPSMPPHSSGTPVCFQSLPPGKQFSSTTGFPLLHERARAAALTGADAGPAPLSMAVATTR